MFDKRLTVELMDFRQKPLKDLSPFRGGGPKLLTDLKINMETAVFAEQEEDNKKEIKKKIVKILGVKYEEEDNKEEVKKEIFAITRVKSEEEEKEDSASDEDDEDSVTGEEEKEDSASDVDDEDSVTLNENMSSYEKMVEKKRAERMAFLKSLQINEVKAEFAEAVNSIKKKTQPVKRKFVKQERSPVPLRKSSRLINHNIDLSEDALYKKAVNEAKKGKPFFQRYGIHLKYCKSGVNEELCKLRPLQLSKNVDSTKERKPADLSSTFRSIVETSSNVTVEKWLREKEKEIPAHLPVKEALHREEFYEDFCKDFNFQTHETELKLFSYDKSVVKNLTLYESNIAKVTPARITAVDWHPDPENLIFAAGDKYGNLGIWKVNSQSNPYVLKTHNQGTTNLMFNPYNVNNLVSSSYEGTLLCGDMVKHVFDEVYKSTEFCTYFDVLSQTTYLVAQRNGQVVVVDDRAEGKRSQKKHTCHDYSIKTVHVHPVNKKVFVTAESKGTIRLWDLRKLQKEPLADIQHHKRSVNSAYFSPVTGNSILAISLDDTISIFDSTNLTNNIKLKRSLRHDNHTGRWLSVFKARWLPNSEEAFVVGSMHPDRRIELYDTNMDVYRIIKHENLCTITSLNIFHPARPALAGANSSGKVVVFTPK